ncbi:hypothetical protein Pan216_46530 [Planctomycetes bacterium Pan216]|uniref:Uncharacterized protein n=2 Tax=Kolteria novifilia TaxID=2527975 RepID=A0A518B9W2_9BACT|nr:hypothetical protein Pan216_46530 [Planctomycetes bacterium Pan216]
MGIARRKAGTEINCPRCGAENIVPYEDEFEAPNAASEQESDVEAIEEEQPAESSREEAPAPSILERSDFDSLLEGSPRPRPSKRSRPTTTAAAAASTTLERPEPKTPRPQATPKPKEKSEPVSTEAPAPLPGDASLLAPPPSEPTQGRTVSVMIFAVSLVVALVVGVVFGRYVVPSRSVSTASVNEAPSESEPEDPAVEDLGPELPPEEQPKVRGTIQYAKDGVEAGDVGSTVVVFPSGKKPNVRIEALGLRPQDQQLQHKPGLDQLRQWGGDIGYVGDDGQFEVSVSRPGPYHILFLSKNSEPSPDQQLFPSEAAMLGQFFADVDTLLADRQFLIVHRRFEKSGSQNVNFVFED